MVKKSDFTCLFNGFFWFLYGFFVLLISIVLLKFNFLYLISLRSSDTSLNDLYLFKKIIRNENLVTLDCVAVGIDNTRQALDCFLSIPPAGDDQACTPVVPHNWIAN